MRGRRSSSLIPEFRDRLFSEAAAAHFAGDACPVPGMRPVSYNILDRETSGIERATVPIHETLAAIIDAALARLA